MADDDRLLDELGRRPLDYSRKRFLWTWIAVGVLAVLTGLALISASRSTDTNLEQTEDIARVADQTADAAQQSADDVDRVPARRRPACPVSRARTGRTAHRGYPGRATRARPARRVTWARPEPRALKGAPEHRARPDPPEL